MPGTSRAARRSRSAAAEVDASYASAVAGTARSSGIAAVLALVVHAVTVGIAALAVVTAMSPVLAPVRWALVVLLGLVVLAIVPRPRRLPRGAKVIEPAAAPTLWTLLATIGASTRSAVPDRVVVAPGLDVRLETVGWRRRRVLVIGMAFWTITSGTERVALLAHALAHQRRRGWLVSSAAATLGQWVPLVGRARTPTLALDRGGRPGQPSFSMIYRTQLIEDLEQRQAARWTSRVNIVTAPARWAVSGVGRVLTAKADQAAQPGEWDADLAAAEIASTGAAVSQLDQLCVVDVVSSWFRRMAAAQRDPDWPDLRATVDAVPPRQVERMRRVARLRGDRVDSAHAATALRMDSLLAAPQSGRLMLTDTTANAITAELLR